MALERNGTNNRNRKTTSVVTMDTDKTNINIIITNNKTSNSGRKNCTVFVDHIGTSRCYKTCVYSGLSSFLTLMVS